MANQRIRDGLLNLDSGAAPSARHDPCTTGSAPGDAACQRIDGDDESISCMPNRGDGMKVDIRRAVARPTSAARFVLQRDRLAYADRLFGWSDPIEGDICAATTCEEGGRKCDTDEWKDAFLHNEACGPSNAD
jgi:hypothetical protein